MHVHTYPHRSRWIGGLGEVGNGYFRDTGMGGGKRGDKGGDRGGEGEVEVCKGRFEAHPTNSLNRSYCTIPGQADI